MNDAQIIAIVMLATAGFLALWLWAIRAAKFPETKPVKPAKAAEREKEHAQ